MSAIPESMRQVRFTGPGGPEVVVLETAPVPKPGPGQVLIEVVAAGVNRPDCIQRSGNYPPPPGATSVPGLEVSGRLKAGETLLVHGGSSGIGSTAIQLARHAGAKVFATAGSDEKCAFCVELGAAAAINYRTQDFVREIKSLTDGRGVDEILDMVGGSYTARNFSALALEGRLVQIAFLQSSKVEIDLMPVMLKRLTFTGATLRPRSVAQKTAIAEALRAEVWPLLESGTVRPVIHAVFPLEEARAAHELMESSAHLGKILLETGR